MFTRVTEQSRKCSEPRVMLNRFPSLYTCRNSFRTWVPGYGRNSIRTTSPPCARYCARSQTSSHVVKFFSRSPDFAVQNPRFVLGCASS
eukprot:2858014-Rhodomonas_salina.2